MIQLPLSHTRAPRGKRLLDGGRKEKGVRVRGGQEGVRGPSRGLSSQQLWNPPVSSSGVRKTRQRKKKGGSQGESLASKPTIRVLTPWRATCRTIIPRFRECQITNYTAVCFQKVPNFPEHQWLIGCINLWIIAEPQRENRNPRRQWVRRLLQSKRICCHSKEAVGREKNQSKFFMSTSLLLNSTAS